MRVYSARKDTPMVGFFRARPLQYGSEEFLYPPRQGALPEGFSEWTEEEAAVILELHAVSGVVKALPGMSDAEIIDKAKKARHQFLFRQLMNYRLTVDAQMKAGGTAPLPSPALRALADEYRKLDAELKANDPVLQLVGGMPVTPTEAIDKVIDDELRTFGVAKTAANAASAAMDVGV